MASPDDFIDRVVSARDLAVTSAADHSWRLEPCDAEFPWYCDLDDGTPTGENDPASFVRWVCPAMRTGRSEGEPAGPRLDVHRRGPQSD